MRRISIVSMLLLLTAALNAQNFVSTVPANRNVILEEFTGSYCQYCPEGHKLAKELAAAHPDNIFIVKSELNNVRREAIKLLEKQMNSTQELNSNNFVGSMGDPAGLVIEPLDGVDFSETVQDQMEVIGENKLSRDEYINQPIEFKDIDMGDYFSNLLKTDSGKNSDFMNFAKKNATNAYNVFTKNLVINASEFVEDILNN